MIFRVIVYDDIESQGYVEMTTSDFRQASERLNFLVESGQVIGGRIEKYIKGQGWVVAEEEK